MNRGLVLTPGQMVARQYRVIEPLGEGGMGAVYVALHTATGKRRALKVMRPELVMDPKLVERFLQEARIASKVDSEHVVDVLDAGVDDELRAPFIVMELLTGETLARRLAREGAMPPGDTLDLFRQLAHGLGRLHARGVVHRDLKPENIFLVTTSDAAFLAKILDFGVAKVLEEAQTGATAAIGTPLYMPPEQMTPGAAVTPASDVWALGLIAFRCLTGKSYWRSASSPSPNAAMVVNEVMNLPMPAASARAAELDAAPLPSSLDPWFAAALHRDPRRRFDDANVAYEALRAAITGRSHPPAAISSAPVTPGPSHDVEAFLPTALAASLPTPPTWKPAPPAVPVTSAKRAAVSIVLWTILGTMVAGIIGFFVIALIVGSNTKSRSQLEREARQERQTLRQEKDIADRRAAEMELRAQDAEARVRELQQKVAVEKDETKKAELQEQLDKAKKALGGRDVPPLPPAPPASSAKPCSCLRTDPLCDCF